MTAAVTPWGVRYVPAKGKPAISVHSTSSANVARRASRSPLAEARYWRRTTSAGTDEAATVVVSFMGVSPPLGGGPASAPRHLALGHLGTELGCDQHAG